MINLENKLIEYNESKESTNYSFLKAKQGSFWRWHRVYVLKNEQGNIYIIQLNIFERIYAHLVGRGIENYFKKTFSGRKIIGIVSKNDLDILVYNNSKPTIFNKTAQIYKQIENEASSWRGNNEINLQTPSSYLNKRCQRKEWWGRFAETIGSTGLNTLIDQVVTESGIALDIGSGSSASAIYLLQKGWTVICLDYSQKALTVMEEKANKINQKWLKTKKLRLIHSSIEEYTWPEKVDLILASSALPYFDPLKIKTLMSKIYQSLKNNGHFIGNFFVSKYVGAAIDMTREMGAWFMHDKDSVGYLLAAQGYKVIECARGNQQNPHSALFIGKKTIL